MKNILTALVFIGLVFALIFVLSEADRIGHNKKQKYFEECAEKTGDYKWCNKKINNPYYETNP